MLACGRCLPPEIRGHSLPFRSLLALHTSVRLALAISSAAIPHAVRGLSIADVNRRHPAIGIAADAIGRCWRSSAATAFIARVPAPVSHAVARRHDVGNSLGRRRAVGYGSDIRFRRAVRGGRHASGFNVLFSGATCCVARLRVIRLRGDRHRCCCRRPRVGRIVRPTISPRFCSVCNQEQQSTNQKSNPFHVQIHSLT